MVKYPDGWIASLSDSPSSVRCAGGSKATIGEQTMSRQRAQAIPIPSERMLANGFGPDLLRESVPEIASGRWQLVGCDLQEVRKQRRKRIVTYALRYRDGRGEHEASIVVKLYGSDRGRGALEHMQTLWAAGFQPPAPFRVPRPYGYSAGQGALLQGVAGGTPWADFLGGELRALLEASRRAADWLIHLEGTSVAAPSRGPEEAAQDIRRFATELSAAFPQHADRLGGLAERLARRLGGRPARVVPSHGDFHPKNVFLEESAVTVIDLDTFAAREAGYDAGYAVGQLLVMSRFRLGSFEPGARAAAAFVARYAEQGGAPWESVATHAARTLMQSLHFELCTLRNGKVELLPLWPVLAEELMESDGPEALADRLRLG